MVKLMIMDCKLVNFTPKRMKRKIKESVLDWQIIVQRDSIHQIGTWHISGYVPILSCTTNSSNANSVKMLWVWKEGVAH